MDARKVDGEQYKCSSLENVRHSLNRYLNQPPYNKNIDIIKDREFTDANVNFKAAMAELKGSGLGSTDHYPIIDENDIKLLYASMYLSPKTPTGLFNKVQFDIRLYFCRRGSENIYEFRKDTFKLKTNPQTGRLLQRIKFHLFTIIAFTFTLHSFAQIYFTFISQIPSL